MWRTKSTCLIHVHTFKLTLKRVPIVAQWKQIQLVSMRIQVRSLALLSGLRIWRCCELWHRLAVAALIQPLASELPYAIGAGLKSKKKTNPKKQKNKNHLML